MGIIVTCRNGHRLNLKNEYAGKTGYCPRCRARISVPPSTRHSESAVADLLVGVPEPVSPESARDEPFCQDTPRDGCGETDGVCLGEEYAVPKKRACPHCGKKASIAFSSCPTCGTRLTTNASGPAH